MKTGKTDILNMISTAKKVDLLKNPNGIQVPFRDRLSRQTEEMFYSTSQNSKNQEKMNVSEHLSIRKSSVKNLKSESLKKYSMEIKSHENVNEEMSDDLAPIEDTLSSLCADKTSLSEDKDNEIESELPSVVLEELKGEALSEEILLSTAIYSKLSFPFSEPNINKDVKKMSVLDAESVMTKSFSEDGESASVVLTFNDGVQLDEENMARFIMLNESEDVSRLISSEKSVEKNETAKSFPLISDASPFKTNLNLKQMISEDKMKEEELSINQFSEENQGENSVVKITEEKAHLFSSEDFKDTSDRESKTETLIEAEKTNIQSFPKNAMSIKERTFEELIESKLKPEMDSGKIMLEDIRYQINQSKKQMKIQLKPKELGEMTLDLQVFRGGVIAKIFVDNEKAKFVIEQNLTQLRETFKNSGTEIKTVEVFIGNNADFQMNQQSMAQSRSSGHSMNYNKNNHGYVEMSLEEETVEETVLKEGFDVLA